jgi:hypothetical protein
MTVGRLLDPPADAAGREDFGDETSPAPRRQNLVLTARRTDLDSATGEQAAALQAKLAASPAAKRPGS